VTTDPVCFHKKLKDRVVKKERGGKTNNRRKNLRLSGVGRAKKNDLSQGVHLSRKELQRDNKGYKNLDRGSDQQVRGKMAERDKKKPHPKPRYLFLNTHETGAGKGLDSRAWSRDGKKKGK